MAIVTIETTTSPFSGKKLSPAINLQYDTDKIDWTSLEPQDDDNSCRFLYLIQDSVEDLPFDSGVFGMAYVNCTAEQLYDVANGGGPAPGLTIEYSDPLNGIALINSFGQTSVSCAVYSPDAGTLVWSVENIVNPTGGGGYSPFFDDAGYHYFEWSSVGATSNGTITFDIKLTIGAQSTTKPFQVVISNL